ncbi:hypothetical protein BKA93DRAFT_191808 [Sparassis latifolia]
MRLLSNVRTLRSARVSGAALTEACDTRWSPASDPPRRRGRRLCVYAFMRFPLGILPAVFSKTPLRYELRHSGAGDGAKAHAGLRNVLSIHLARSQFLFASFSRLVSLSLKWSMWEWPPERSCETRLLRRTMQRLSFVRQECLCVRDPRRVPLRSGIPENAVFRTYAPGTLRACTSLLTAVICSFGPLSICSRARIPSFKRSHPGCFTLTDTVLPIVRFTICSSWRCSSAVAAAATMSNTVITCGTSTLLCLVLHAALRHL